MFENRDRSVEVELQEAGGRQFEQDQQKVGPTTERIYSKHLKQRRISIVERPALLASLELHHGQKEPEFEIHHYD